MSETSTTTPISIPRRHPYYQIALTYLPRRRVLGFLGFLVVLVAFSSYLCVAVQLRHDPQAQLPMLLLPESFFLGGIILHLKSQLVTPRAALVPNYRLPHILVAVALGLPVILASTMFATLTSHVPFLPTFALFSVAAALVLWSFYLLSPGALFVFFILWFGLFACSSQQVYLLAFTALSPVVHLAIIAAAVAAILALGRRLMLLREEMPEYARHIAASGRESYGSNAFPYGTSTPRYDSVVMRLWCVPFHRQLSRLLTARPSPWRNFRRWQYATVTPVAILPLAIFFLGEFLFLALLLRGGFDFGGHIIILFAFATSLPLIYGLGAWPTFANESLRPFSRTTYLWARALTLAFLLAKLYLAFILIVLIIASLLQRPILRDPEFWFTLAASVPSLCLVFALALWFLRYHSLPLMVPYIFLSFLLGSLLTIAPSHLAAHLSLSLLKLLAFFLPTTLVLSALILCDAYRRWLRTDLG